MSTIYRRTESNWLTGHPSDKSLTYWRAYARKIFSRFPRVEEIEICRDGRKSSSEFLRIGADIPARNQYVVIASTGGRWGRSRRDYPPANL